MCSLTRLRLTGMAQITHWPPVGTLKPINLPSLKCLYLVPSIGFDSFTSRCVSSFFATFTTPSLHQLALDDMSPDILASFLECLHHGTFRFLRVTSLTWNTGIQTTAQIATIAQSFPAVEDLSVLNLFTPDVLKFLLAHNEEGTTHSLLWPRLRRVNLNWTDFSVLRDFVSSRIGSEQPIQEVRLHRDPVVARKTRT